MTVKKAELMKLVGSLLIVVPMMLDHFLFEIPTYFMLPFAFAAAIILAFAIVWLKIDEVKTSHK